MSRLTLMMMLCLSTVVAAVACAGPQSPAEPTDPATDVVARVGDLEITAAELDADASSALFQLQQKMYETRMQVLEGKIFDLLVAREAEAAGVSAEDWLDENLVVAEPDEAQIMQVMAQYRSRLAKDDDQARKQVVDYLKQQGQFQARMDLQRRLTEKAGVEILLEPPRVHPVIADHNPSRGPADAPVTIIEYTDFQCPYCSRVQPTLDAVKERYGDSVRFVFKNLPLAMHDQAVFAAEAGLCAGEQDAFWPLHDWMFANARGINRESVLQQAGELGLDVEALTACLDEGRYAEAVAEDTKEANSFGITGTPGFTVNGRILTGAQPLESFVTVIDDELRRAGLPVPEPKAEESAAGTEE